VSRAASAPDILHTDSPRANAVRLTNCVANSIEALIEQTADGLVAVDATDCFSE